MIKLYKICNIPINNLLHDDKPAYKKEGHGGKQVWHWPIYKFFRIYHLNKKKEAQKSFCDWYIDQYQKYSGTPKSQGGMKNGSLDRFIKEIRIDANSDVLFKDAVLKRVNQRFQLLESISSSGYNPNHIDPVKAFKSNDNQYIVNSGHHRIAILAALGYDVVPEVYVFKNNLVFILYRCQQKLIKISKPL